MNQITIDGNEYTIDEKTLKTHQKKLKALIFQNKVPALAVYITVIFAVFGLWVLFYQTIMWSKTSEWNNLPWYQTIVKSEPTIFHYLASVELWLVSLIIAFMAYFILKRLLPTGKLTAQIQQSEHIVNELHNALIKNDVQNNT